MRGEASAEAITACWQKLGNIQPQMLNFLENHDEQRLASPFFAGDARLGIAGMTVSAMMNINPVMIYCGQELGEPGMDEEGFSGRDGRTTIFDYWSIQSIRDWNNGGRFDKEKLSPAQVKLRETYAKLLNIAKMEPVVSQGEFYDLMYANKDNPYMNVRKQYVFLRKWRNEVLLAVANFDRGDQSIGIRIPVEAFQTLGIEDNKPAYVTDLFTGKRSISTLSDAFYYQVKVPAYGGALFKFSFM